MTNEVTVVVGGKSFHIAKDRIRSFPKSLLGGLLESLEPDSPVEIPDQDPEFFENVVLPFYTNISILQERIPLLSKHQMDLDYWGIPNSVQSLHLNFEEFQQVCKQENESFSELTKIVEAIQLYRINETNAQLRILQAIDLLKEASTKKSGKAIRILLTHSTMNEGTIEFGGADKFIYQYFIGLLGQQNVSVAMCLYPISNQLEYLPKHYPSFSEYFPASMRSTNKRSPYMLYAEATREHYKLQNPDARMTDIVKAIAASWTALADEEKAPYIALAEDDSAAKEIEAKKSEFKILRDNEIKWANEIGPKFFTRILVKDVIYYGKLVETYSVEEDYNDDKDDEGIKLSLYQIASMKLTIPF